MDSLESILGLLNSLKIPALFPNGIALEDDVTVYSPPLCFFRGYSI
jgi:hypothetical protein